MSDRNLERLFRGHDVVPVKLLEAPHSYPAGLEQRAVFDGRDILLRPMRATDLAQHRRFLGRVSAEDLRTRFFLSIRELPTEELVHLTQVDYEREMAFIAVASDASGVEETLGVARACIGTDSAEAEFAVLVRSDLKGRGLGTLLLQRLISYCRSRGVRCLKGQALYDNLAMRGLAERLGFRIESLPYGLIEMKLVL